MSRRPRVLFVQRGLEPPGGAAGVAALMVQALQDDHALTLLTWQRADLPAVNQFFGTAVRAEAISRLRPPAALRAIVDALPITSYLLRTALLLRQAKRLARDFDVLVTGDNEADFGPHGVQYVNYPWDLMPRPVLERRWYHLPPLVTAYRELCIRAADFSLERMRQSAMLVNSEFIAGLVRARYGLVSRILYPPVFGTFPEVAWEARDRTFLCVGRIAPDKELDRVIDILARVRAARPEVRLRIVGTPEGEYAARIAARVRAEGAGWITLESGLSRDALTRLMAGHRYGIHGHRTEHFGMVVAEMVRAGCIVWVPNAGGQVEIVGDERLRYDTVEGAAAAIVRALSDPAEEADLRWRLAKQARLFSTERFVREFREVVAERTRR